MIIECVFKKRSLANAARLRPEGRTRHGKIAWAQVEDVVERIEVYFNARLPEGTPWLDRWVSLGELRITPKPQPTDPIEISKMRRKEKYRTARGYQAPLRLEDIPPSELNGNRATAHESEDDLEYCSLIRAGGTPPFALT